MIGGEAGFRAVPAIIANRIYQAGENISSSAKAGDTKAIEKHLTEGADVNGRDPLDGTPLHWAAVQGHTNALKLLIGKGADVNATDLVGQPPLLWVPVSGPSASIASPEFKIIPASKGKAPGKAVKYPIPFS